MCVDNKVINKITIKYIISIPQLKDLSDKPEKAQMFSYLDLKSSYRQIHIKKKGG